MTQLIWDKTGEHYYESGVDRAVLYIQGNDGNYGVGEAWNGLTKVGQAPEGAEATAVYANNNKYLNLISQETFKGTIEAYTAPDAFAKCDGSHVMIDENGDIIKGISVTSQTRSPFGLTYRTKLGNDVQGLDLGYTIHLVYNATVSPSSRDYQTINDTPEALALSWSFNTVSVPVPGMKPTAHLEIKSTETDPKVLKALEEMLYGTASTDPKLPTPEELVELAKTALAGS